MQETLKVTSVMSDQTRFNIYQYLVETHEVVNVRDIAKKFNIHPNVARLHLTKLEEINLITFSFEKTGKGGRPGKVYQLSNQIMQLNFPAQDYKTLSSIALETIMSLGEPGKKALYETGRKYGLEVMNNIQFNNDNGLTIKNKIIMLEDAGRMLGMYPSFKYNSENKSISFSINNCPFKELANNNHETICEMHHEFLKGMFEAIFSEIELIEEKNMFVHDCKNCEYIAKFANL